MARIDWVRAVSYLALGLFSLAFWAGAFLILAAFWQKFGSRFS